MVRLICRVFTVWALLVAFASPVQASTASASARRVTIDAGHGGSEIGASYRFADGSILQEKEVNLQVALQLGRMLQAAGVEVSYTRTSDTPLNIKGQDLNGDGRVSLADELQARVDAANASGSDLFVSVCFNGSSDPSISGTETFWDPKRAFADQNRALAQAVQHGLVTSLASAGYATRDRGANTDVALLNGDSFFLLGPASPVIARPSKMPAVIAEPLFVTNPADATALRDPSIINAVARGFFSGIQSYLDTAEPTPARPSALTSSSVSASVPASASASALGSTRLPAAVRWSAWAVTYSDTPRGRQLAADSAVSLNHRGIPSQVLSSGEFSSLVSGYLVVVSGSFPSRTMAIARAAQLRAAGYTGAYVRPLPHN